MRLKESKFWHTHPKNADVILQIIVTRCEVSLLRATLFIVGILMIVLTIAANSQAEAQTSYLPIAAENFEQVAES